MQMLGGMLAGRMVGRMGQDAANPLMNAIGLSQPADTAGPTQQSAAGAATMPHAGFGPLGPSGVEQMMVDSPGTVFARHPGNMMLDLKAQINEASDDFQALERRRLLWGGGKDHFGFGGQGVSDEMLKGGKDRVNALTSQLRDLQDYMDRLRKKGSGQ